MKHHIFHTAPECNAGTGGNAGYTDSRLILLFAGWGMDEKPFTDVTVPGYDICVVWDYTDPTESFATLLPGYAEIAAVAWSFGVPAAAAFICSHPELPITAKIAINGTQHPIDDRLGIPAEIFRGTLDGLTEKSLGKFYLRMAGSANAFKDFSVQMPERTLNGLRSELLAIQAARQPIILWDKAVIADNDRIIPSANQLAAWENEAIEVQQYAGSHLPNFNRLLNRLLTDKTLVKQRFRRATGTYDSNAVIQRQIAHRLISLWSTKQEFIPKKILEIGCGTGTASRLIRHRFPNASLTLWDLSLAPQLAKEFIGCEMKACDAETAIRELPSESIDTIVSASTVQWFNSLPAFLTEASRVLRPGGKAVISTFGPQTMHEINDTLGYRSPFPTPSTLRRMIPQGLEVEHFTEENITLTFQSPIEALRHVSLTGVNAIHSQSTAADTRLLLRSYPTLRPSEAPLTYTPIYIILAKHNTLK